MNTPFKLDRRQFLALSGLAAGSAALAACGVKGQEGASGGGASGPVTLEFWQISQGDNYDKIMKQAITDFEADHSTIKINMSVQPQQDMDTKCRSVFTSGGPGPDVLACGSPYVLGYSEMPYGLADLSERVKADGLDQKIPSMAWTSGTAADGKVYAVPYTALLWFMQYNKDMYAAAGISGPPETVDDLLENSRKLVDPEKDEFGYLAYTSWIGWLIQGLFYNNGLGLFQGAEDHIVYDTTQPITFNSPEAVRVLEYIRELGLTAPGGLSGNIGVQSGDADAAFAAGNLGHYYTHTIHTSQIQGYNADMVPQVNWDICPLPAGSQRSGVMFSPLEVGITKTSKNQDAAWEFLSYVSNVVEGSIGPAIGSVPLNTSTTIDESQVGSWLIPIGREIIEQGDIYPEIYLQQSSAIYSAFTSAVDAYFMDQKTAEEALNDAAEEVKNSL
jgi:multiple sugar transport system substrate-binding protein